MSSPSDSPVSSTAASIDGASPRRQDGYPWLPEPGKLPNTPWYEEKSSNLKIADIATIKEKEIKRLGPEKFYISHKGDHTFIKGNPSSHKGWMSMFFYIKCDSMRDPWRCEMHWRDNVFTHSPRTPDRTPSLTPFLEAMRGKSYNSPELIKEDLLCFFKFSRKGVELVGDLDERMGKAELLQAMQEAAHASGEVAPHKKVTKKRKAPSLAEKEDHGEKRKKASASSSGVQKEEVSKKNQASTPRTPTSEEAADVPPVLTTAEASSLGKGPERGPPFDPSRDSLVESPSAVAATRYICNMAPDRDLKVLRKADGAEVIGHFAANLASIFSRAQVGFPCSGEVFTRGGGDAYMSFGLQCSTSPLLPPRKDPLEDLILQLVYRPNPTTSSCENS
ncbi:hypothetical protein F511_38054 [Dorcoceras hygrometricum]|uniref:Uncharacterized protein n=1 Tax=Dorcoceras hygrometricum TaxID=472368 RepID=A0A2Z7BWY9_9LAMI|nr:hypothetical protein F511_38054 [Dorcoceras hygrometricum]